MWYKLDYIIKELFVLLNILFSVAGCRSVSMSKTNNEIPTIPGTISLYAMEKADCFRTCFDYENCHYIAMERIFNGVYCMIYLTAELVTLTMTPLNGAAFYTIECTGKIHVHV